MKFRTKGDAQEAVAILKRVKRELPFKGGDDDDEIHSPYICGNIREITGYKFEGPGEELHAWIRELLDGAFSLREWLKETHGIECPEYSIKLQETRQAWLDWMIQEIKTVNKL